MRTKILIAIIAFFASISFIVAQPWLPDDNKLFRSDVIPRVDISIHPDTLTWLYENVESNEEFHATFIYACAGEKDTVENVGFRLRGNTSRFSAKKSFKVSFNTFTQGGKFKGVEKLNLNGEHNDPSIIRSFLGWHLCEDMKIPGARTNHVELYINGNYHGLYANVEHIDEEFIQKRYGHNFGNLYKCLYGATLDYLDQNAQTYADNNYTLKTNTDQFDYTNLINLTYVISNSSSAQYPQHLEPIFNVNGFLRYLAMETFTSHWDAYTINQNNYYLYENQFTGKIEFIPYDLDNTYGIDWFLGNLANRDIYNWGDMILTEKVLANQIYRDRYSFFINEIITKFTNTGSYFTMINQKRDQISASAGADPFRPLDYGWTHQDFLDSYNQALGAHVTYGIKPYITQRIASINQQLNLNPISPIIENIYHNFPVLNEIIKIKADIIDDNTEFSAKVYWKFNEASFTAVDMINDSLDIFSAEISAMTEVGTFSFYIEAIDSEHQITRDPYSGEYEINFGASNKQLVINEFMASNSEVIYDNYGETDDWLEIKNIGTQEINLSGLYLSDEPGDKSKWSLPNVTLQPNEYYLVWTDKDPDQGDNHANFKLSSSGEFIGIFDSFSNNYAPIDTLTFGQQTSNISYGLNGLGDYVPQSVPTPMGTNESSDVSYITFNYNMNKQIQDGSFDLGTDFIDIAGTFNSWNGSVKIYDGNEDGIHTATLFGFYAEQEIEYKARMGADWSGGEFPGLGGDANRIYTLLAGANNLSHWFNDEALNKQELIANQEFSVYPNPVTSSFITINSAIKNGNIAIYAMNGSLIYSSMVNDFNNYRIPHEFTSGMYIVRITSSNNAQSKKIIVQ